MSILQLLLVPLVALILIAVPLIPVFRGVKTGKKAKHALLFHICSFFALCALAVILPVGGFASAAGEAAAAATGATTGDGLAYLAAALATGLSSVGAGIAVAAAAPAAIGAFSEDAKNFGKSLIFVALGEGVAIYGLLISILIITNL